MIIKIEDKNDLNVEKFEKKMELMILNFIKS